MCICQKFIESSICGSDNQNSMLDFHKENPVIMNLWMVYPE